MPAIIFTTLIFLWVAGYSLFTMKRKGRANADLKDDFIESERAANSARRKAIDEELFFKPDFSLLPDGETENNSYKRVLNCAERTMLRFKEPVSNTELKLSYGPSQIEDIAYYEENFNEFLRALLEWAESLINLGLTDDALRILEYTLALGSDYRRSYKITADIYAERGQWNKLDELLALAEGHPFRDEAVKRNVVKYIMNMRQGE